MQPLSFALLCLIAAAPSVAAAVPRPTSTADTLVDGRTYRTVPMAEFVRQLRDEAVDTLRLEGAVIVGPLFPARLGSNPVKAFIELIDVRFTDPVSLDGATFASAVRFEETVFEQGLSMQGARFRQAVEFARIRAVRHINCKRALFDGSAKFSGSRFEGLSSFVETKFHGSPVAFDRVQFGANVFFESSRFLGNTDFGDAQFADISSFKEAEWSARVTFAGVRFKKRADFTRTKFRGRTVFDEAMVSGLTFDSAEFDDEVTFRRMTFIHPARFSHAIFRDRVSFAGSLFMMDADFSNSRFDGGVRLRSHFDSGLDLRHAGGKQLDMLPPALEESVARRANLLAPDSRVMLQHAVFENTLILWPQLAGHLGTDAAEDPVADLQPVYDRLCRQLASLGLRDDAVACRVEWQELRLDNSGWTDGEWYWLQLLRHTTHFGTDLWQFARFAAVCVLFFGILLRVADRTGQSSFAGCLYASVLTFVRLLPVGGQSRGQQFVLIVAAVVSWACWGMFVATVVVRHL